MLSCAPSLFQGSQPSHESKRDGGPKHQRRLHVWGGHRIGTSGRAAMLGPIPVGPVVIGESHGRPESKSNNEGSRHHQSFARYPLQHCDRLGSIPDSLRE
jgi:hypothetical protein